MEKQIQNKEGNKVKKKYLFHKVLKVTKYFSYYEYWI